MQLDLSVPSLSYLTERPVHISAPEGDSAASLGEVAQPRGVVILASDSGAARHRVYERELARAWRGVGFTTLMVDLISSVEQEDEAMAAAMRIDAKRLAHRIACARAWLGEMQQLNGLPFGLLGEGGAGAAALIELSSRPLHYAAAVLRDAQPLRAGTAVEQCALPVLLVVDTDDRALVSLNRQAVAKMHGDVQLATFSARPCAGSGDCQAQQMAALITRWLTHHLLPVNLSEDRGAVVKPTYTCRPCSDLDH